MGCGKKEGLYLYTNAVMNTAPMKKRYYYYNYALFHLLLTTLDGKRIALTDSETPTPFLCTGSSNTAVQWASAELVRWMHASQVVEIGPRGIRFVDAQWPASSMYEHKDKAHDDCSSTFGALCESTSGLLFPNTAAIRVSGMVEPVFNSSIATYFFGESGTACAENGEGRVQVIDEAVYTVSACDIMQGHSVIMFQPASGKVFVLPQTFGPMAYTVILVTVLICIYGASGLSPSEWQNWLMHIVCGGGSVACCLLYAVSGIAFVTVDDEIHFWLSIAGTWIMGVSSKTNKNMCIFMLGSIADALYRSPETPYAGILAAAMGVQVWQKVHTVFFDENACALQNLDCALSVIYLCCTIEIGLVPQYADAEDWPIYGGMGALATFVVAWSMRAKDVIY